jgi:class 3 adenylate cyclase/tetratricopeptide (TPR) repeat protein
VATCPACAKDLPGEFSFCPFCGAPLTGADSGLHEERKLITVLFTDLVGFTARAEHLDPEEVRALLGPYHARLRSELERFGGTVEKFIGDAVMALFGAPVAHEDDPERAVRAAIAIRDWVGEESQDLQVRIAVNTGEALITLGARPSEGEAMAAGDVVNTAARIQTGAPVNGILVGEQTYRATAHVIDYRETEPVIGKGKSRPIPVWEALQPRSGLGVDVAQRAVAPFVGRGRELELLQATLARVREECSPQLVTLVGVPGIGKSRLVFELFQAVERDLSVSVTWRQGRSLPYGDGVTFWALAEIVKAQAGILESDSGEQAEGKLRRAVVQVLPDAAEARWIEDQLRPLAGLTSDLAPNRPGESFAAWRRFLEVLGEQRPLVLVFEDLHWADDALLDFIDQLVDRATNVPLLVLVTARPELLERREGWGGGKPNALTISLSPLADKETARLVATLLERPLLEAKTQTDLLARAGGNPLYAEQYARILLERGALVEVPETVQGIIAARLDALSHDEKRLLQDAAVVGEVFWLGAVEAIDGVARWHAEELLHGLERKEFVQRARHSSVGSESEYAFRHVLIRDVAYGQIPRAARSEKHRLAAEWIESLGRPDDHAEMLAHHYLQALEYARATGRVDPALAERARFTLRDAGDRALSLGAYAPSARFYALALELWPREDPERAELLFRCGRASFWADGSGVEELVEAFDHLRAAGIREGAAEAARWLARLFQTRGEVTAAYDYIDQALGLVEGLPQSAAKAEVLVYRSTLHLMASEFQQAIRLAREALPMVELLDLDALRSRALNTIGTSRVSMGDADGLSDIEHAIELARAADAFDYLHQAYNNLRFSQFNLGRLEDAAETLEAYRETVEHAGTEFERRFLQAEEAGEDFVHGRWDDALERVGAFLDEAEAGSPHYLEPRSRAMRASIRLARGDADGALSDSERGAEAARRALDPQAMAPALCGHAAVLLAAGRRDEADLLASELLQVPAVVEGLTDNGAVIDFAWLLRDLGRQGEFQAALEDVPPLPWFEAAAAIASGDFARAAEILSEIGFRPGEAYTRLRAAEALVQVRLAREAEAELERALTFYRSVGATRYVRQGEALMAEAAEGTRAPSDSAA